MKKTLISILGAVAVFAGCTKENENYGFIVPEGKELVKITATAENSRTTVDIDDNCANYAWNFSDTLAVVEEDAECPSKFTLVDAATGTFAGVKTEGKSLVFAITPEAFVTSGLDVGGALQEFSVYLPDFYDAYVPGTTNALMVGTPAETADNGYRFYFRHAAALVKVRYENVPKGTAGFCLTTDQVITGNWVFDSLDDAVLTNTNPQGSNSVWMMLEKPVSLPNQTLDFYVPVPVGEYGSLSIALIDENLEELPETIRSKQANFSLERGELFTTPVVTLPEESLEGSYIIVSKAATKGNWVVMQAAVNDSGRWLYDESGHAYTEEVNLDDSSVDFAEFSNIAYRFDVIALETGGYVLRNAQSGNYVQFIGSASNKGKEVSEDEKAAFNVFKVNANGTWAIGDWYGDTDFYSLQYNVGYYFTFYKSNQAGIYLIPYVGAATPVKLSGSCSKNTVTLTAIPEEAEIRYTVDGGDPDAAATLYEEPFEITESCTVKAIAFAPNSDYMDSDIFELECTYVEPGTTAYYEKVTTAPDDWCGEYLMVCENQNLALSSISTTQTKYGIGSSVDIADGEIEASEEVDEFKITIANATNQGTGYTFYLSSASAFLSWSSGNSLASNATESDNTRWTIIAGATSGNWVIANVADSAREIWYNTSSPRFACYTGKNESSSGYAAIQLYKLADSRTPLSTPDGLSVSGMEVSWSPVEGAETYTVTVGSTVASVQGTSYTYEGEAGYYNVSVVAVPASGSAYSASKPAVLEDVKFGTPVLPAPELSAGICTTNSVQVTWTADERATNGYHASIGVTGAHAISESKDVTEGSVTFDGLESGTEYTVWVNAKAVEGDQPWEASQSTSIELSTTQGSTTIADAITACPSDNFTLTGVTVVGVASSSNALIGDGTGFALVYKSNHGLALGDVVNISGATTRYKGVVEFNQPAIEKTGTAPAVAYGDPVDATSDLLESFTSGDFDITYVRGTGAQSARNITLDNGYVLYMHTTNAATDGKAVTVSGLVYGWDKGHSNFNFFFTSIEEDTSAPTLSVSPKVKNWAYNDTSEQEFTIEYTNGTLSITPDTIDWADINYTPTGSGISVKPKNENTTQTKREAILTVTVTPYSGNYEAISVEISLSQGINSGGGSDPVTVSMDSFSATSGYVDGDENVSYEATKGTAGTAPAVYNNEIRIYQNGGLLTITANNDKTITNVTIGSSMATTVQVSIDGGTFSSNNSITASGTYSTGTISASSTVVFKCTGTDKNSRLYLNSLSVTYE